MEGASSSSRGAGSRAAPSAAVSWSTKKKARVSGEGEADRCAGRGSSQGKQPACVPAEPGQAAGRADGAGTRWQQLRKALCLLSALRGSEAVSELASLDSCEPPAPSPGAVPPEALGLEVLRFATLGVGLRELRDFAGADRAFCRARALLLHLVSPATRTDVGDITALFPAVFAAGVASCLRGHPAWTMCCLDLKKSVLASSDAPLDERVHGHAATCKQAGDWEERGRLLTTSNQHVASKAAGKKSSAGPGWLMATSDEVDVTILVHEHTGTVVALKRGSPGSFRFAVGECSDEHICAPQGHSQIQQPELEGEPTLCVLKAALRSGEGQSLSACWNRGPWSIRQAPDSTSFSVVHSAWAPCNRLTLGDHGFTFVSSVSTIGMEDGKLVAVDSGAFSVDNAEHQFPELLFRIGVALSMALVEEPDAAASRAIGENSACSRPNLQMIDAFLTSESLVADLATKAQLMADGGTHLHVLAHSGDAVKLSAVLQDTSKCLYVGSEGKSPQQELAEGDEVRLSPDYRRYRDAPSGPLRPADIGIIVAVQHGSNQPLRVSYGGRSWWYSREALEPLEPPRPQNMQDRCACVNCVNRCDRQGKTALHVLAANFAGQSHLRACRELVQAGACLHQQDDCGRTPLLCLLESPCVTAQDTSFATLRSAVKLLVSEKALRARDIKGRSAILAAALLENRAAIVVFDALLNTEYDWAWTGTSETDALLDLAVKRSKMLAQAPVQYRHAAESALARLLGKHICNTECEGECACQKGGKVLSLRLPEHCEEVAVHSALDAFGIFANSQDAAFWEGVELNVSMDRLLKGGWKLHEAMLYNQPTKTEHLDPGKGEWLCIGAREVGKDVLLVAAMAKRRDVLRRTSGSTDLNQSNGVYWYCCPGKSFGFSRYPRVDLRSADTEDTDGEYRLSWHLDSDSGGWRAGMKKNLVREAGTRYEKVIFYLSPSKTLSAEPCERFFIGRHVTLADKPQLASTSLHQPVPDHWGTEVIEQIRASSNQMNLSRIKDGSLATYWESDRDEGIERKHWLELQLRPNCTLKTFGLIVQADTAKYCPKTLITSVGQSPSSLRSLGQSEFLDLPMDKAVMLPLLQKPTMASVIRVDISDQHLGDNCRVYGVCFQVATPGDEGSENLEVMCGRVVDKCSGSEQGKWLVATSCGATRWFRSAELKPLGPTFPQSVSLRGQRITRVPPAVKLRGVAAFPFQALQHLCLADNNLSALPDDLASALPGLITLDLSGNALTGLPCAVAHMVWLRRVSLSKQRDTLHDSSWLDAISARFPSFIESSPQALEAVLVDFDCVSALSKALVISLATKTIQRCASTCVDLRGRGLGDDALEAIMPKLLECCSRRHGLVECLRNAPKLTAAAIQLPLVHPHPLVSGLRPCLTSRDAFCSTCRAHLSPATGFVCEHVGCDFSLCVDCAGFLSKAPNSCIRTVCSDGHHVQISVDSSVAPGSILAAEVDGEPVMTGIQAVNWNARTRELALEKGRERRHVHLRNDAIAAGLLEQIGELVGRATSPAAEWRGDAASQCPVCHVHGQPMQVMPPPASGMDEEWQCSECCSSKLGTAWRCRAGARDGAAVPCTTSFSALHGAASVGCSIHCCLQCWPFPERASNVADTCRACGSPPEPDGTFGNFCSRCGAKDPSSATLAAAASMATGKLKMGQVGAPSARDATSRAEGPCPSSKSAAPMHALEVPLVDLRDNPITHLPPRLLAAVSNLGAGIILSDLSKDPDGMPHSAQGLSGGAPCASASGSARGGAAPRSDAAGEGASASKGVATLTRHQLVLDKYTYTGEVRGNKEHGRGKRIFRDGSTLEGVFVEGKRHGPAVHTFKNEVWTGSFKDDVMQKDAVLVKHDCRYEGEMHESKDLRTDLVQYVPNGRGVMVYRTNSAAGGCRYDGSWKLGKRHGAGTLTWPGSSVNVPPTHKRANDKGKEPSEHPSSQNPDIGGGATYEGVWEDDCMQGQGILSWPNGRTFHGAFMADRVERGFLVAPEGSSMLTFSQRCPKFDTEAPTFPQLPAALKHEDMGMISADVILAVKNGASEAYAQLARCTHLSVADRILLIRLHASENPPEAGRQALKVKYAPGANDAAANILRALMLPPDQEFRSAGTSVAKNLQWAIELEKPKPPTSAQALDDMGKNMLKEDIRRELERRGLDTSGLKPVLEARLEAALALERPIKAVELKMPVLKNELESRGLDTKGLKRELVARLQDHLDEQKRREEEAKTAVDEVQEMFSEAARGLAGLEVSGMRPLILTPADSLQPEPLASSKEHMQNMRQWYEAVGRLIGGALWHRKSLPVPLSRFFCRRVLEMVPTCRLKAYSSQGRGPPVFSGGASALIGTRLSVRDEGLDAERLRHCPQPRLERVSPGLSYVVKEVRCLKGRWFVKMEERVVGQCGWLPIGNTSAKADNLVEPEAAWREMRRQNSQVPYNACFPKSVSSGQPVRLRAVLDPPSFYSAEPLGNRDSPCKKTAEGMHPELARRMEDARNLEYGKCLSADMSPTEAHLFAEIAADAQRATWQAERRRQLARESRTDGAHDAPALAHLRSESTGGDMFPKVCPYSPILVGSNAWTSGEGVCVLPEWVMDALGLVDGDEVQVEPLQPPLNKALHTMTRGVGRFSSFWYCGRKKRRNRTGSSGHLARCGPDKGEPCAQCNMTETPDCSGGLARAGCIAWRLPQHHLAGELEVMLKGEHLASLLNQRALHCVMKGVPVPLVWGSSAGGGGRVSLALMPESVWNSEGEPIHEAVLTADTEHRLLPPLEPRGAADSCAGGHAVAGAALGAEHSRHESNVQGLLAGEMLCDYLESAAADDLEREQIKKNEFGWLLWNKVSDLKAAGLLPPRFAGIVNGLMLHKFVSPTKPKGESSGGASGKKRSADGNSKATRGGKASSAAPSAALPRGAAGSSDTAAGGAEVEVFTVLAERNGQMGEDEKGRCELLERWLHRTLYEQVQEQAYAVSRGLREVVPAGLLALFSAPELQALLGGGPSIEDATLSEWMAHTEYDNGLDAEDERVKWFWCAVKGMPPAARTQVWTFATGLTRTPKASRGGFAALDPRFNVVGAMEASGSSKGAPCADWALVTAATCHRQLVLPRFSSAEVTARQLLRSVEEGLASAAGVPDSFEAVQRKLLAAVHKASAREGATPSEAAVQEALRKLFPNSYMCGKCGFGPVDHVACTDLRSHHGEKRGAAQISNACPKCAWFSPQVTDWPPWDGRVWSDQDQDASEPRSQGQSAADVAVDASVRSAAAAPMPPQKRRRR